MTSCPYCGFVTHDYIQQCPAIKAIDYYPDGTIKRVEKFPPLTHTQASQLRATARLMKVKGDEFTASLLEQAADTQQQLEHELNSLKQPKVV